LDSTGSVDKDPDSEYLGKMVHKKEKIMKFQFLKSWIFSLWDWMLLPNTDLAEPIPDPQN
jgi:hypothetical protein